MGLLVLSVQPRAMLTSVIPITLQLLTNFVLFFVYLGHENKAVVPTFLLNAVIILLVGYPACRGLASVIGSGRHRP